MNVVRCPSCGTKMKRNGTTSAGNTRWRCASCGASITNHVDNSAKRLEEFLGWLLSKRRQADMAGGGRTFRRRTQEFWHIWPLPPVTGEVCRVVFVDGIYLSHKTCVLISRSEEHVLGWYVARSESSGAYKAPHGPHSAPRGGGYRWWQWLSEGTKAAVAHHARAEVHLPCVRAGEALYDHKAKDPGGSRPLRACQKASQGRGLGARGRMGRRLRHVVLRLRRVSERGDHKRRGAQLPCPRAAREGQKLAHRPCEAADALHLRGPWPGWASGALPATNNAVESLNGQLRHLLREHRGLSLERRIKAICWWCYMHTECPLPASEILKVMPTDKSIAEEMRKLSYEDRAKIGSRRWGDGLVWEELHRSTPWRRDWD